MHVKKIAVLGGTGDLGLGLVTRWLAAGYAVTIGSRDAARAREAADSARAGFADARVEGQENRAAAQAAEVVVLAIPFSAHAQLLEQIREVVQGKIVVDTTVPLAPPKVSEVRLGIGIGKSIRPARAPSRRNGPSSCFAGLAEPAQCSLCHLAGRVIEEYLIAYQIGALQAMAAYVGERVTHLKPHGALNNMAAENADYAMAIGRAIKAVDPSIIYVTNFGSEMEKAGRELGLKVAREGYCDRQYEDDGSLTPRKIPGSVIKNPEVAAKQVVNMVVNGVIISRNGKGIEQRVDTLCVHGDEPTGVATARAARGALEAAGVKIVRLPEMKLG